MTRRFMLLVALLVLGTSAIARASGTCWYDSKAQAQDRRCRRAYTRTGCMGAATDEARPECDSQFRIFMRCTLQAQRDLRDRTQGKCAPEPKRFWVLGDVPPDPSLDPPPTEDAAYVSPRWWRTNTWQRGMGTFSAWLDESGGLVSALGALDVDVSEDRTTWFHLAGKKCAQHLPPYDKAN